MIELTNTSIMNFENAIRGMRNPLNSWDKSDSYDGFDFLFEEDFEWAKKDGSIGQACVYNNNIREHGCTFVLGQNDLKLARKLVKAGSDHRKFLRQIFVSVDILAPLYWIAEHDTYKVATVRNSCSFMHKGVSKPFEITDFSVDDERIYEILNTIDNPKIELIYPYETNEYKIYTTENGRKYKVYKNGRIFACEFSYCDNYGSGRIRHFEEKEVKPSVTKCGYFELRLGGRSGEKWLLHRLIATVWIDNTNDLETVNHINGNKGDNSVENLEWCTKEENIRKGFESGLYDRNKLHSSYIKWKNSHVVIDPFIKLKIKKDHSSGLSRQELSNKYDVPLKTLDNILYIKPCENIELFMSCYEWERVLDELNNLRLEYIETKDETVFQTIRKKLPQGYNVKYTWTANYETVLNQYHSRKNHRLPEWHAYCDWIESLPYFSEICLGGESHE